MDDMAMTFHVVSDLNGQVDHQGVLSQSACCNSTAWIFPPVSGTTATTKTI